MRYGIVIQQLGALLLLLAIAMIPSATWSLYDHLYYGAAMPGEEEALYALLISSCLGMVIGLPLYLRGRKSQMQIGRREALLLVALAWLVGAGLSAMPFRIWAMIHDFADLRDPAFNSYINCYFEAMSGLTTTGASILTDIESIPRSLLFWRAFTHWIGGIGIVVLFVAVLPLLGVGGKRLYRFEVPGPKKEGVRPRIRAAARVLILIYISLTLVEVVLLRVTGLGWFDSIAHSFATMATGGFSTYNTSITALASWKAEIVIILFMFMAGVNFGLYDLLLYGRWREVIRDREFRAYFWIILSSIVLLSALVVGHNIVLTDGTAVSRTGAIIRQCVFTAVSIQTTTGFGTADFDLWSFPAQAILIALMFVGGCAGSTGGGVKVIRFVILAKVIRVELERVFRPQVIRTVRLGNAVIDPPMRSAILFYFVLIGMIVVIATGLVIHFETPQKLDAAGWDSATTAFSAVVANLNNIGPGLDRVGPSRNYAWMTAPSKLLLTLLMAMGRLELYAFLVLTLPIFWQEE